MCKSSQDFQSIVDRICKNFVEVNASKTQTYLLFATKTDNLHLIIRSNNFLEKQNSVDHVEICIQDDVQRHKQNQTIA